MVRRIRIKHYVYLSLRAMRFVAIVYIIRIQGLARRPKHYSTRHLATSTLRAHTPTQAVTRVEASFRVSLGKSANRSPLGCKAWNKHYLPSAELATTLLLWSAEVKRTWVSERGKG